ncbi:protein spire homolog 1 isoform X2 [Amia ocellicauda]|uniref:protein spire homolog 1 isoform X2 n=1 Tax=Amia ocellicauda TaxID=2972642 RepID=UPI0034643BB4
MDDSRSYHANCQISLSEVLELQGQPVSEEQAWALCHQLCCLMVQDQRLHGCGDRGPWKAPRIRGAESILLKNDGTVCLAENSIDASLEFQTEDEVVDFIGRLIYTCLDWGLGSNVERDLSETLEIFICQMTKLDSCHRRRGEPFQPICTFSEVIEVCENRLYNPAKASHHYKAICSILFAETIDLCQYLHKIQHTKETLQKLVNKPECSIVAPVTTNWVFSWRHVIDELRRGVNLKAKSPGRNVSAPLPTELSPYEQLLKDIQYKRYNLRKVKTLDNLPKQTDPHGALLDFVRSNPVLRPASSRKLKSRPKEEASLHELLMEEIRSAAKLRPLSSRRRRAALQDNSPPKCVISMSIYEDSSFSEDSFCLINSIPKPDLGGFGSEGASRNIESSDGKLFENNCNRSDQDLKFSPLLSSSPVDLESCKSEYKRRSKSFDGSIELERRSCSGPCKPLTIADVMKMRQMEMGSLQNLYYTNWRVCSCCYKRSLYFTWHNSCYFCNRVVCPECCMEILLPHKWCVNLPVSFFKIIVTREAELNGKNQVKNFWQERWDWDSSRVPLVLDSRVTETAPQHRLAMKDWYSNDICVGCKGFLINACDSVISRHAATVPREI